MVCVLLGLSVVDANGAGDLLQDLADRITKAEQDFDFVEWNDTSVIDFVPDCSSAKEPTLLLSASCKVNQQDDEEPMEDRLVSSVEKFVTDHLRVRNAVVTFKCEMWASAPGPLPLRPADGYDRLRVHNIESALMCTWGVFLQKQMVPWEVIHQLHDLACETIRNVETELARHQPQLQIGHDNFWFIEIASRGKERFDLRLLENAQIKAIVDNYVMKQFETFLQDYLETTEIHYDLSIVYSRPGAEHQGWHADGDHVLGDNKPYAICLFLPLVDLDQQVGFTQYWPATHLHHDLLGFGKVAEFCQAVFDGTCNVGDGIWYDYRTMHRGMPNFSDRLRPVLQIIFKQKWYVERANYGKESFVMGGQQQSS
jgi:hypothetical protein